MKNFINNWKKYWTVYIIFSVLFFVGLFVLATLEYLINLI